MTNATIWQARTTSPVRPITEAEKSLLDRIPTFAGQPLTVSKLTIKVLVYHATVTATDGTEFVINVRHPERKLLQQAGYELPTGYGEYPFTATVIGHMVTEFGTVDLQIKTVMHKDTGEPVSHAPVAPKAKAAPLQPMADKVDKSVYKYHGETVTVLSAQEIGRGRTIWKLECRADNGDLVRVEAWSNHNRMFTEAGHNALPETEAGKVNMEADGIDVILEYSLSYRAYRIAHVFPRAGLPTLAVVEKPVRYNIPVTIEADTPARTGLRLALRRKLVRGERIAQPALTVADDSTEAESGVAA